MAAERSIRSALGFLVTTLHSTSPLWKAAGPSRRSFSPRMGTSTERPSMAWIDVGGWNRSFSMDAAREPDGSPSASARLRRRQRIPSAPCIESSGLLYGTTYDGGAGARTVFGSDFRASSRLCTPSAAFQRRADPRRSLVVGSGSTAHLLGVATALRPEPSSAWIRPDTTVVWNFGDVADGKTRSRVAGGAEACMERPVWALGSFHCTARSSVGPRTCRPQILSMTACPVVGTSRHSGSAQGKLFAVGGRCSLGDVRRASGDERGRRGAETIELLTPVDLSPGTLNDVTVTEADVNTATLERAWLRDFSTY